MLGEGWGYLFVRWRRHAGGGVGLSICEREEACWGRGGAIYL